MTLLQEYYASKPVGVYLIRTLEIRIPGEDPIRICQGYIDQWLMADGALVKFQAGSLNISLPSENDTGNQKLSFGVSGVNGIANEYVLKALETNAISTMIYREYLSTDKTAPARKPYTMTIKGGAFEGPNVMFEGGYYDVLNSAWPRDRYTSETAPGVQYL